jgi:hypothetical protein
MVSLSILLSTSSGHALETTSRALLDTGSPDPNAPETASSYGMSLTGGGGVIGFVDPNSYRYTSLGASWDARLTFGTRFIISPEIGFMGTGHYLSADGLNETAQLLSTGGEVALRLNVLPGTVQPYVLSGIGYARYRLIGEDRNTSKIDDRDVVVRFPVAAGVALRYHGFVADLRATGRPVLESDLFEDSGGSLDTVAASLNAGVEF